MDQVVYGLIGLTALLTVWLLWSRRRLWWIAALCWVSLLLFYFVYAYFEASQGWQRVTALCSAVGGTKVYKRVEGVEGYLLVFDAGEHADVVFWPLTRPSCCPSDFGTRFKFVEFRVDKNWMKRARQQAGISDNGLYRASIVTKGTDGKRCVPGLQPDHVDLPGKCVAVEKISRPRSKYRVVHYFRTWRQGLAAGKEYGTKIERIDSGQLYGETRRFWWNSRLPLLTHINGRSTSGGCLLSVGPSGVSNVLRPSTDKAE